MQAHGGAWWKLEARDSDAETSGGAWRRVGGPMKTKFHRKGIGEISFRWCNLWSDRRSGSGGGGKAVVFDVLKSRWRQWCCSQQWL